MTKLVSACLLGIRCAYDGKDRKNKKVLELLKQELLIPVCPEQLGGLPTPRIPQAIYKGEGKDVLKGKAKVINRKGQDVTKQFIKGAKETLKIAKLFKVKKFIAKSKSPSCGCGLTYGPELRKGDGVTTALLKQAGIEVINDDKLK